MDETKAFIIKAKRKLKHSKTLYEVQGYSDSVTLSYYAMFLTAKALLIKRKCKFGKSHQNLIKEFSRVYVHEDTFDYNIYKYLASTQSLREEADYNAIDTIDERIAKQRINQAEKFIKEAEKFL